VQTLEEWRKFVMDLRDEWRTMWRDRIDDKVRAEGIANRDYSRLFVDRGTVIVATRDYKPPDFMEILEQHKPPDAERLVPPSPSIGGWGKFIRSVLSKQKRLIKRRRPEPGPSRKGKRRLRKGGRGWLHFRMR
jgi:hypothetical protein